MLTDNPNSNLIICGDLNQLNYKDFLTQLNLLQMVNTPTRKDKILDVFITKLNVRPTFLEESIGHPRTCSI